MRDELIKTYGTKQHKVVTLIAVIYDTVTFTVMVACLLQLIFGLQVEQQSNMIILWTLVPHINIDFNGVSADLGATKAIKRDIRPVRARNQVTRQTILVPSSLPRQ